MKMMKFSDISNVMLMLKDILKMFIEIVTVTLTYIG